MVRRLTDGITGKMRSEDRVCWHRYGALSGGGTHTCLGQSLLKAWIKLWSWCRVNMKAFTAVKKTRLWLEFDVRECFLMPAFADSGPFKSSRAFAGSLPSKICWINDFTLKRSEGFIFFSSSSLFFFFPEFSKKDRCLACSSCLVAAFSRSQPQGSSNSVVQDDQTLNLKLLT